MTLNEVSDMLASKEQYIIDSEGNKTGVILSMDAYQKLLEDMHDLAVIAERRDEEPISLEEMKQLLAEDGLL